MARNAEKAMTTLARWRQAQLDSEKGEKKRRPFIASDCHDLQDAERFRLGIIREISKKVTQIQNAGLGEFRIRDLNDQINKLLREKNHWEQRIAELGGANFRKTPGPKFDVEGKEVPGNRGYKYFGAAKDLPGVRELFSQAPPLPARKTRAELMRNVDAYYFGLLSDEDIIVPLEREEEKKAILKVLETEGVDVTHMDLDNLQLPIPHQEQQKDEDAAGMDFIGPATFVSHVPSIPNQEEVREELLRRKKEELLKELISWDV